MVALELQIFFCALQNWLHMGLIFKSSLCSVPAVLFPQDFAHVIVHVSFSSMYTNLEVYMHMAFAPAYLIYAFVYVHKSKFL